MIWPFKKAATSTKPGQKKTPPKLYDLDAKWSQALANPERDQWISASMQDVCLETFPDNEENRWTVWRVLHLKKHSFVLMKPHPNDVGYDLFIFVLLCVPGQPPEDLAVYALEEKGTFFLLATSPGCPDNIPNTIKWRS